MLWGFFLLNPHPLPQPTPHPIPNQPHTRFPTKNVNRPDSASWPDDAKHQQQEPNRFHLSHAHIQMARELGMNPKKLGGKANHRQEPWKLPLPEFIEELYLKRFGKTRPDSVRSVEQMVQDKKRKQAERKARKQGEASRQSANRDPNHASDVPF